MFRRRSPVQKKLYNSLKNLLGFRPGNLDIYEQSLRHKSAAKEIKEGFKDSNERLEFLGDAILGAVIAEFLFRKFPYKDEGFLTKMRAKIVSRAQISMLSKKLGLDELVITSNEDPRFNKTIRGDALEAFIGAVYIDKGYKVTSEFILNRLIRPHLDLHTLETTETDYKSKLIEYGQAERKEVEFIVENEEGKGHQKTYTISANLNGEKLGTGIGHSKKAAEQSAAQQACSTLNI